MEILFVVVGLAVGAGLMYLFIQSQLKQIKDSHEAQVRRMREGMEQDFTLRLDTAVKGAQVDRDRTIQQVRNDYEQRIAMMQSGAAITGAAPQSTTTTPGTPAATTAPAPTPLADPWDNRRNGPQSPAPDAATPAPSPESAAPTAVPSPAPEPIAPIAPAAPKPAIAQLKRACAADDGEIRAQAARELANHLMGAEAENSLTLLETLAGDRQATVRIAALETLADAQIPDTIPMLEKALNDANPAVVRVASKGLQGMKGARTILDVLPYILPSNGAPQGDS
ncbi:MAG: HEAT repeat domain-containing protein [Cyanophyceae cyanobacterium]